MYNLCTAAQEAGQCLKSGPQLDALTAWSWKVGMQLALYRLKLGLKINCCNAVNLASSKIAVTCVHTVLVCISYLLEVLYVCMLHSSMLLHTYNHP